jgi:hypothetical protein
LQEQKMIVIERVEELRKKNGRKSRVQWPRLRMEFFRHPRHHKRIHGHWPWRLGQG